MISGIYRIYSIATGESYYGSSGHIKRRFIEHRFKWRKNQGNHKIRQLLREYGVDNFKFEILEECSVDQFEVREREYIANDSKTLNVWINPFSPKDCNLGNGVKGKKFFGTPRTAENKVKHSQIMKEYYSNNDGYWKGRSISEETKMKVSLGLKKYFETHMHPNSGKKLSEATKLKISETLKRINGGVL